MKPKQFFFVVLGIIVLVAGGGGAAYYFGITFLHQNSAALSTKLAEQQEANNQINDLHDLRGKYLSTIVPIQPQLDTAMPHDKKQTEILAQIERIASDVGVAQPFDSVQLPGPVGLPSAQSQTSKDGAVLAMSLNFSAKGSTQQLQTFTARLENLNRYTNITVLSVKHTDKKAPTEYDFSLNAYIMP